MKMIRTVPAIATAALVPALLLLPACHKTPGQTPQNSQTEEETAPPPALPVAPPPAIVTPKPEPENMKMPPPDTTALSEDEQIREDAAATGMTSRVHRDGDGQDAAATDANSGQE